MGEFFRKSIRPACDGIFRHLHVEKNAVGILVAENLAFRQAGVGEPARSFWKIEHVALPVKPFELFPSFSKEKIAGGRSLKVNGVPAYLFSKPPRTPAPRALAKIWLPKQIPNSGTCALTLDSTSRISSARNG